MSLRHGAALGVLSLALLSGACGEGAAESDEQDVRASYERFVEASATGDAKAVCTAVVPDEQRKYVNDAASKSADDPKTCEEAFTVLHQDPVVAQLARDEAEDPITSIEVAGDRALVVATDADGLPRETQLVRRGEAWKVAGAD
jgi:hypothetical protein